MGKIKLKLPGSKKDPNTAAKVELPIDMSPTLIEGLNRGVRLQARKNVRANSFKRDPETGKLIPYEEWKAQQTANKPTEPQISDNVVEFPALAKAASTSPGLANLLAKSLGAGVGGTIGALGGGAGAAHLAHHLGAGDTATALTGILGMGAGGLGGVLVGSSVANKVTQPVEEGDPKAEAQASYANTGSSPAGYTADPDEDFSDDDLDKYASMPPQQGPPRPANQLARRPVTNTLPPSPGLAPAAAKAGAPPTGNLDDLSIKLQGTANDALDMQAKQASRNASILSSSYNQLTSEDRMIKIAAVLQKATDNLKLSDRVARSSGRLFQLLAGQA